MPIAQAVHLWQGPAIEGVVMADHRDGGIAWTDITVNPIRARARQSERVGHYCEKISPG